LDGAGALEGCDQFAGQPAQERVGPAGLHFQDQRLAFMRRHAGRGADRLPGPSLWQAAFVQRVSGFVQHPHHGLHGVGFVVARGDAHVALGAAAERMR
jgi:hypothetical protein